MAEIRLSSFQRGRVLRFGRVLTSNFFPIEAAVKTVNEEEDEIIQILQPEAISNGLNAICKTQILWLAMMFASNSSLCPKVLRKSAPGKPVSQ